jgi:hypothetical protein
MDRDCEFEKVYRENLSTYDAINVGTPMSKLITTQDECVWIGEMCVLRVNAYMYL